MKLPSDVRSMTRRALDVPRHDDWLGPNERATLSTLQIPKRRSEWRLGRWTAKRALRHGPVPLAAVPDDRDIEIRASTCGAPEVFVHDRASTVAISISHSRGVGFCVATPAKMAIGCDTEFVERRSEAFISDYFCPQEREATKRVHPADHELMATLIWSAKESVLKALREGLRLDLRSVVVDVRIEPFRFRWNRFAARCPEACTDFHGWWRSRGRHVYTVAVQTARRL